MDENSTPLERVKKNNVAGKYSVKGHYPQRDEYPDSESFHRARWAFRGERSRLIHQVLCADLAEEYGMSRLDASLQLHRSLDACRHISLTAVLEHFDANR